MKKIIALSLALMVGSIVSAQKFSLDQTTCNSLRVEKSYEGYDQYAVLLLEKEQLPAVWSKIERIKLHATEYQFGDLKKGRYRVTLITPEGNRQVSNTVLVDCTNANDDSFVAPFNMSISPNPAASQLQVNIPTAKDDHYKYHIISTQGLIMIQGEITNEVETIDIAHLRSGIYFLKVISQNNSTSIKKIIIQ